MAAAFVDPLRASEACKDVTVLPYAARHMHNTAEVPHAANEVEGLLLDFHNKDNREEKVEFSCFPGVAVLVAADTAVDGCIVVAAVVRFRETGPSYQHGLQGAAS